jgi:hypothetical protein
MTADLIPILTLHCAVSVHTHSCQVHSVLKDPTFKALSWVGRGHMICLHVSHTDMCTQAMAEGLLVSTASRFALGNPTEGLALRARCLLT